MTEAEIINHYFRPLVHPEEVSALDDDAAELVLPAKRRLLVTTDALIEGVHFTGMESLADIGRKLVAVNVSDCLAKGALPYRALLVLIWPRCRAVAQIGALAQGIGEALAERGCALLGGDSIVSNGPLTLAMTMHGLCDEHGLTPRATARANDDLWVSGNIGDAHLGLLSVSGKLERLSVPARKRLETSLHNPAPPPNRIASLIAAHASAATDVSDGLIADAARLARTSKLAVAIEAEAIPLSADARLCLQEQQCSLESLVTGGDDYQTLFAAPRSAREAIFAAQGADLQLSRIGKACAGKPGTVTLKANGQRLNLAITGFDHFADQA